MRLLDLYCGAGGAAAGYARPYVEITGIDLYEQPRYPFSFIRKDAREADLEGWDIIHASPPCLPHSPARWGFHPETYALLADTVQKLHTVDARWIVENVPSAWAPGPYFTLCGASLGCVDHESGMFIARHRRFWTNAMIDPPACACAQWRKQGYVCGSIYGALGGRKGHHSVSPTHTVARRLMGIDWMSRDELTQAIPPVYTSYIMQQWGYE